MTTAPKWKFDPTPLIRRRQELGMNYSAFGRSLKRPLGPAHVKDIELRRRAPRVDTLVRICNEIGLAPSEFFRRASAG